jgi:hypothetical protein
MHLLASRQIGKSVGGAAVRIAFRELRALSIVKVNGEIRRSRFVWYLPHISKSDSLARWKIKFRDTPMKRPRQKCGHPPKAVVGTGLSVAVQHRHCTIRNKS